MDKILCTAAFTGEDITCSILKHDRHNHQLTVLGCAHAPHPAMSKGEITDMEALVDAFGRASAAAKSAAGIKRMRPLVVGITGNAVQTDLSTGMTRLGSAGQTVSSKDIENVINVAKAWPLAYHHEILHVIPQYFTLDGQKGIQNPRGLFGLRLEVVAILISARQTAVKNLFNLCHYAGFEIVDVVYSGLASSYAVSDRSERKGFLATVHVGYEVTDLIIYDRNLIKFAGSFTKGVRDFLQQIETKYSVSLEKAKQLMRSVDFLGTNTEKPEEEIISGVNNLARHWANDISSTIYGHIGDVVGEDTLNYTVKISGSTLELENFIEYLQTLLKIPVFAGHITGFHSQAGTHIPAPHLTSIGLAKYLVELDRERIDFKYRKKGGFDGFKDKLKYILSEYF